MLASVAVGASAAPTTNVSASMILASTKRLAADDCRPHEFGGDLRVARCAYSPAAFINGQWSVIVHYILVGKDGKVVGAMGADSVYVFGKDGKFVKIIPGM